ncbi:hypothetical protein Tco_1326420 [Tanacetum coccineum]
MREPHAPFWWVIVVRRWRWGSRGDAAVGVVAVVDGSDEVMVVSVTSDESSDDTLKSSSEDTCSSDWSSSAEAKKATIPSEIVRWYDDLCSDDQRTIYKGRRWSSFRNAAMTKPKKPKSRSKHHAPTIRIGSTCTTLVVPTKRPPPVTNCVLSLAAVTTWQRILNKELGIISSKEDVGGSSNVRSKGKRKML